MRRASHACVLRVRKRVRRRNDRAGGREYSDVRANGGRRSCNEIQPHWIHGAVSGAERPNLLKFLVRASPNRRQRRRREKIRDWLRMSSLWVVTPD